MPSDKVSRPYSIKGSILAFLSGAFFFFLVLSSLWWIPVAVVGWMGYIYGEHRHAPDNHHI